MIFSWSKGLRNEIYLCSVIFVRIIHYYTSRPQTSQTRSVNDTFETRPFFLILCPHFIAFTRPGFNFTSVSRTETQSKLKVNLGTWEIILLYFIFPLSVDYYPIQLANTAKLSLMPMRLQNNFSDYLAEVNLIQTVSFMARNVTENEEELILIFVQLNYAYKNIL